MSKVLFTTKYTIESDKINEYKNIVEELKNLFVNKEDVKLEIYKVNGKENTYQEVYYYLNEEVWERADEDIDERYDMLMAKLSEMIVPKTTEINTLFEID